MDQAVIMLKEAADQGHGNAQEYYGCLHEFGWGVAKDDRLCLVYFEKAAEEGDARCQLKTGLFYRFGRGCEQSYERAAEWLHKAAVQGHPNALSDLGGCYLIGEGVPQNIKRGIECLKKAVLLGNVNAQFMLGQCRENGTGGAKDYLEARRLYTLASAGGFAQVNKHLTLLEKKIRAECPLLGKQVMITGTSRKDLKDQVGLSRSFDEAKGRYVVRLRGSGEGGSYMKEMERYARQANRGTGLGRGDPSADGASGLQGLCTFKKCLLRV